MISTTGCGSAFLKFSSFLAPHDKPTLVGEKYKEPVDGKCEDATDSILQRLKEPEDQEDTGDNTDLDLDL